MLEDSRRPGPNVDPELLVALVEYGRWATAKTLDTIDQLPPAALTEPVTSSFPTLLATLNHVYGWDQYYFTHLQGGRVDRAAVAEAETYEALKRDWAVLHRGTAAWARANLAERKDLVLEGWGIWPAWMVVMQMVNHATHHLGQVVTLVRQLGYPAEKIDSTDLIRYLLRRYPQENQKEWVKALLDRDATPLEGLS